MSLPSEELYILGLGAARPSTRLSAEFLTEISGSTLPKTDTFIAPNTCLTLDYLRETKNLDIRKTPEIVSQTPTELGFAAAQIALVRAGIESQQIGLIIGDCLAPFETTPSESQRIGKKLDLKVPAYDINSGVAGFALGLQNLRDRIFEKTPEYVLLVVSSTPTQRVDYAKGEEGFIFSDAAIAAVISKKHLGKLKLSSLDLTLNPKAQPPFKIDLYGHLKAQQAKFLPAYTPGVSEFLDLADRWDEFKQGAIINASIDFGEFCSANLALMASL